MVDDSAMKEMRSIIEFSELDARHRPIGKTLAENTELSLDSLILSHEISLPRLSQPHALEYQTHVLHRQATIRSGQR